MGFGFWVICLQCFDTDGGAAGKASHVFCDYNLAIILIFAVLEIWLIQH